MKRIVFCVMCLLFASAASIQAQGLLIDDFEGEITGGPSGTVDFGSGNGSSVNVSAATDVKNTGDQSLKVEFDAVPGGYMWIARGWGLDVKTAACWLVDPEDIDWAQYNAIAFYMHGENSGSKIAVDVKDAGGEMWRSIVEDNFSGWKQVVCTFDFLFARSDWQPNTADVNGTLDFPLKSFQFEPLAESKGVLYFDTVELISQ
jgi:hypothetical protein